MLNRKVYETELAGEKLTLEVSGLAGKTNAAVLGRYGETVVLATVVMGETERGLDYFPLTVDYEERFYAAGKVMGSRFLRREGRPSDEAIISARIIDRTIRPLFDHRLRREVQVVATILAYDEKNDPDAVALLATSTALSISDIPWNGPVAGVGIKENSFFAGTKEKINMIELEGKELSEEELCHIFDDSHREIKRIVEFQEKIVSEIGKPKAGLSFEEHNEKLTKLVRKYISENNLTGALKEKTLGDFKKSLMEFLVGKEVAAEDLPEAGDIFEHELDAFVRREILEYDRRSDNRALDEVRELYAEVSLFRRTHGSGLFIRGETQILAMTTLAPPSAEQLVETLEYSGKKRFMLHYNFPSFSTGEVGRMRGPGRREIGHGTLAAKAVACLIPPKEEFPYTIRVVAETLSSNGSTSMASACAASLSLMDAGVPIKKHVAGIAMGLVTGEGGKHKLLTDIQGPEDHHGDMDFKVAGTRDGVTAIQMDVKIEGITKEIFLEALRGGEKARHKILDVMEKTIPSPRPQVSEYAPTILTLDLPVDKIGWVIGPGGRTIHGIIDATDSKVSIDIDREGKVFIAGTNAEFAKKALALVEQIIHEYKPGEVVEGTVEKILDFGAIVNLGGEQSGMIHVSELKDGYVKRVEDVVKVGDFVRAKVLRTENGKIALSLKGVGGETKTT